MPCGRQDDSGMRRMQGGTAMTAARSWLLFAHCCNCCDRCALARSRHAGACVRVPWADAALTPVTLATLVTLVLTMTLVTLVLTMSFKQFEAPRSFRLSRWQPAPWLLLWLLLVAGLGPQVEAAYSCDSDADCQYEGCNDRSCSGYESYSRCNNGVWDAVCVSTA